MIRTHNIAPSDDAGMTLVELIVGMVVSALFLGLVATMFGNSLAAQQGAADRDLATGKANAAVLQLNGALRDSLHASVHGGSLLLARELPVDDPVFEGIGFPDGQTHGIVCEAWTWSDVAGQTYLRTRSFLDYPGLPARGREDNDSAEYRDPLGGGYRVVTHWSTTGGAAPVRPASGNPYITYKIGSGTDDGTVMLSGGGFPRGFSAVLPDTNPCGGGWSVT